MSSTTDKDDISQLISREAMDQNLRQIHMAKAVIYILGGLICGVLGFTGLYGLLFYMGITAIVTLAIMAKMGFQLKKYTSTTATNFAISGVFNHVLSFIMWWTLAFALVYIY
jgi:hypothetical protein